MTQSLEELREAIRFVNNPKSYLGSDEGWAKVCAHDAAARSFLQLLSTHTPEKIEALLKGEAWIAPYEATDEMLQSAAEFWLCEEELPKRGCIERKLAKGYWEAMRQSSEVNPPPSEEQ